MRRSSNSQSAVRQQARGPQVAILAACALLSAAALAGCIDETGATGSVDRSYTVSGPARLELTNGSGNSRVSAGAAGQVTIHAEFHVHAWPWDDDSAEQLKELVANPPFTQSGDQIRIGEIGWHHGGYSADYTITVPPDTQMRGISGSGNVEVDGIAGPADFKLGSGNVRATGIKNDVQAIVGSGNATFTDTQGRIEASAGSGEVIVRGVKGDVRAHTGSGEIRIERADGNVEAGAGSGNVEVRDATADLRIHTASGEIRVEGNPGASNFWDIRASSGDVSLHVPPNASFRFYAHSSSGGIHTGLSSLHEESGGRHELQARVGDGKARVEIGTSSGDISLH
jgi:DUF4097 and DUF4098 domain-containing protein YvlB